MKKEPTQSTVKSIKDACFILNFLFVEMPDLQLEDGVTMLLEKLNIPAMYDIHDRFPELIQQYGLPELIKGNIPNLDTSKQIIKSTSLLSCLQSLILCTETLIKEASGKELRAYRKSLTFQSIEYMTQSAPYQELKNNLFVLIGVATGRDYYTSLKNELNSIEGLDTQRLEKLDKDPRFSEHIELIKWSFFIVFFLDAIYYYFNNYNPKNNRL